MNDLFLRLEEELSKPLPGEKAQFMMSPQVRRPAAGNQPLKKSAVLILLYPHNDLIYTVLIKRTEYNGAHSGQVGFPGGIFEQEDDSLEQTALRETTEETGMPVHSATIIGQLTPLHIPVSNIQVFSFVAGCPFRPEFHHDPVEVQFLIETSMGELLNPANRRIKTMPVQGRDIQVPYFDIQGHHVWGATAMIISEFNEIVKRAGLTFSV